MLFKSTEQAESIFTYCRQTRLCVTVFDFEATLPFKAIDVLAMITIGQVTGRRKFELLTIVPSDIQLDIIRLREDVVV